MIRIEPLRDEDLPLLGALIGRYADSLSRFDLWLHPCGLLDAAFAPTSTCLLAWDGDEAVGYGVALPVTAGGGGPAWLIDQVYSARARVGPLLLRALEAAGKAAGYKQIIADVARPGMERAMRFYGYRVASITYVKEV